MRRVMRTFALMWALTAVGLWLGSMLPESVRLPVSIGTFILLIIMIFVRKVRILNAMAYAIPVLIGITLFWTTQFYIEQLGTQLVLTVFGATIAMFVLLGVIGWAMPDIHHMGSYLFAALLVLIVFMFIFISVPVSNVVALGFACAVVLLFVLYTIYDFNQMRYGHIEEQEVVVHALNLYLDFINLFVRVLEIVWRAKDA
ncbi:hypothetical protein A6K76_01430 [Caryophanon latum]|uniref:BAX inhibitor protein n=2 Tax=Caryophanon latum TaxID=33977 RepID=A0A1C0YUS3_9BACL|nr:hypothetical protein A6K76_01430 [Caryophanon latum]